jgi:SAM-dependent methyltransferase
MSANFGLYSAYYNLLYADKNYSAEAAYVANRLKIYFPEAKSILEFGSGTGTHGIELIKKGFEVFGIERSESMVVEAKLKGFPCVVGDITKADVGRKFDSVFALFHVISYLTENDSLIMCFKNAHRHLNAKGIFLFDVWYSPAVYNLKATPRIKKMRDENIDVIRIAEPVPDVNKNIIDVRYTIIAKDLKTMQNSEIEESHPMRHFSWPELDLLASSTGFEVLKAEEYLSGKEPGDNSWGVCFILRKK